jgi:peptidoglycan/LPS O-acetylase OafA/YrhL
MRWLDALKGLAIALIVLNHIAERTWGAPLAGNKFTAPLSQRISQWAPMPNAFATVVRDIGWTGDQGVTLFVLLSGLGLAYGLARRRTPSYFALGAYFRARGRRIYPLWWAAHLALLAAMFLLHRRIDTARFVLSFVGIRGSYFPAWWFFGLIVQCYLAFPLLWWFARRFGAMKMTLVFVGLGVASRAAGVFLFGHVGSYCVVFYPEFAVGVGAGIVFADHHNFAIAMRTSLRPALLCVVSLAAGFALSFTLHGMIVAPLLMGTSVFVLGYILLAKVKESHVLVGIGAHSYVIFLAFDPVLTLVYRAAHVLAPLR